MRIRIVNRVKDRERGIPGGVTSPVPPATSMKNFKPVPGPRPRNLYNCEFALNLHSRSGYRESLTKEDILRLILR